MTPQSVPPGLRTETVARKKIVYFKGRLYRTGETDADLRWYGGRLRCPEDLDIDEPGHDGTSTRDHIHLYITGLLEQVYGGTFVHQDSDERRVTTIIEEYPLSAHSDARWARFWRRPR
jgi:hypothetical protein